MADRICTVCGASNPPTASFCRVCDTYIDWSGPGEAPTSTGGHAPTAGPTPTPATSPGPTTAGTRVEDAPAPRSEPRAEAPVATIEEGTVVVARDAPGTTRITLKNASDIVDGLVVHPLAAPAWLVVTHEDANLMPGESRTVVVTMAARQDAVVVAQQLTLELVVRSSVDPTKLTQVSVGLVVPPVGPPPTLTPRPAVVHLQDATEGTFTLAFDNRAANFPRRYALSVHDPEDVVRARFLPPVVDVPAGGTVEATVHLSAPAPAPGREATRQVTVTGTAQDAPVSATVTLVQRTSAAPERVPVVLRLEPSHLRSDDGQTVAFDVLIDNRAGHLGAAVALSGRDPQRLVAFAFGEDRLVVPAGRVTTVRARARTTSPPPGTVQSRPFSVVANDGAGEVEAAGVIEVSAQAAPITTAALRVDPQVLATVQQRGTFMVHVDNRAGAGTLQVQLTGADEFGRARLTFTPPTVVVPAGQVGFARLEVDSERPPGGTTSSRRLRVTASDGRSAVETEAVLTQTTPDRRPVAKRWLVVLGALLAMAGALLPWMGAMIDPNSIVAAATSAAEGDVSAFALTATAASTVLVLLLSLLMLLGLNGSSGRAIRFAALLMVLVAVAAGVLGAPATGILVVLLGAVLGFVGGVLARATR
ncbi:hypothetical protein [uncultured Cellulomonas sp.]|uniref:hypothetical protein n=1 Tax=uncultured Cellulomonas sp. TaxID=189682 RepID=UPI0028EF6B23|nr:hypothetical protein [uncultured Cellulomonas sp.]